MSISIGPVSNEEIRPRITVCGIGGAGGNAVANMIESQINGVDFIVANTDAQAPASSSADKKIQLGPDITGGLGAGALPEKGRAAAEETVQEIEDALEGVNMVFIAAGMGGGTGTGAAPVIAEIARRKGILTVGVVTKPFTFEGSRRMRTAEAGIGDLQRHVDTLVVIPNQNLFLIAKQDTTLREAFRLSDEVLYKGVRSITDLMVIPGLINLDFADISSVMSEMGKAMMGTGEAQGDNRALQAAEEAIANPLLDGISMKGAKGVIVSIVGGEDMTLLEVDEAANYIRDLVDEEANIIWGSAFSPELEGKIRVSVVATGIESPSARSLVEDRDSMFSPPRTPKPPSRDPIWDTEDQMVPEEKEPEDEKTFEPNFSNTPNSSSAEEEFEDDFELTESQVVEEEDGVLPDLSMGFQEDKEEQFFQSGSFERETSFSHDDIEFDDQPTPFIQEKTDSAESASTDKELEPDEDDSGSKGETLFERMANLSRSSTGEEREPSKDNLEEEEQKDNDHQSSLLSIPRFLGRQNNQ